MAEAEGSAEVAVRGVAQKRARGERGKMPLRSSTRGIAMRSGEAQVSTARHQAPVCGLWGCAEPNIGGNCECFTMCPGVLLLFCSWTSGEPSEFRPKIGGKNEIFKNKFPEFITIFVLGPPVKPQNFAYKIGG